MFDPKIVQFGTMNAPANFEEYFNHIIMEPLDDYVSADLDDILIYSNSEEEHEKYAKWVMPRLLEARFYLKPEKCEFHKETFSYPGLNISTNGISINGDMIETVSNWSREKKTNNGRWNNLIEVQQFLVFCSYYRPFIPKYSENAEPLTRLTKKDEPSVWHAEQQLAFEPIVTIFTTAYVPQHFNHDREVII